MLSSLLTNGITKKNDKFRWGKQQIDKNEFIWSNFRL